MQLGEPTRDQPAQSPVPAETAKPADKARPAAKAKPAKKRHLPGSARGTIIGGIVIVGVTFFGFGTWASLAPLASAVVAPATVIAEGRKRVVQHFEGGIISEIHVAEGQTVRQGDLLFKLDPVQAVARAERLRNQLTARRAYASRLVAERDDSDTIAFDADLVERAQIDPAAADALAREQSLFDERRRSLEGQVELLRQKIVQLGSDIEGLDAQEDSKARQIDIIERELADLRPLLEDGLIARPRFLGLERESARLQGEVGEVMSRRARASEAIAEAELQIVQLRQQFREDVVTQLRDVESQILDLEQQLVAAQDVLDRLEVMAPESGIAQAVSVTTIGAVISPGQPLLEIAPVGSELLIEARVSPASIHEIARGNNAEVRFVTLDMRRTPTIFGRVESMSGDRLIDRNTGVEYFLAQVRVSAEEMQKLGGQRVSPGVPAEVVVPTGERTMMDYLIKPLMDAINHGLRER
ncbi:HlyD family type I secretion periplasmic adaptor subunit [Salinarimonas ramus]|uniref:Membrane fusion protein (MFP) family protein n=1 Tax=Salinarimonas ramus TaxID=690164 RepID=A0A917QFT5_9HYPH|nr:HlyD family type I secretion periplasmic adaptor subunit [Salinarimonas ramus]GGK46873.1 HlyD family type I secretion periplasmic adaptor subunit [Salinarimonas ramus]